MKTCWKVEVWLHTFLTLALDGGEWSASRPGRFTTGIRGPGMHWIGGWVGPKTRSGRGGEEKVSHHCPCRESKKARSFVAILTELLQLLSWHINKSWHINESVFISMCSSLEENAQWEGRVSPSILPKVLSVPVWWPWVKNSPAIAHACRKRRIKWAPSAWGYSWATRAPEGI
jgi:hypothetical protein